jgi:hypothetical protein
MYTRNRSLEILREREREEGWKWRGNNRGNLFIFRSHEDLTNFQQPSDNKFKGKRQPWLGFLEDNC